ncbi:hypothetical protein ILUMI_08833 [Ignelater luminosus]|uniref:CUE domain-containing protein n=1 Tax=Ignelater luminosus TaxID=2038154 RepID=A0A8K0D0X7_IGNLU|nr:hypothetical protein ILUMI_08833 [Ignelater luminosus]
MDVICSREDFFKNPHKLPLNELNFKHTTLIRTSKNEVSPEEIAGMLEKNTLIKWQDRYQIKEEKKPALDKCWLSPEKRFVKFHPFYPQFSNKENEEFLRRNLEFLESIDFLTKCTYHQFWCYVMCEPRVSVIIKSFLEHSVSPYAAIYLNEEFLQLYNKIYSTVCCIYERLLHFNVSPTEHMLENFVLPFLKRSKLLNVRTIFILCYIYNYSKPQFVKNIIDFYFSDKYKEMHVKELEEVFVDIVQEFERLDKLTLATNLHTALYKTSTSDPLWLEYTSSYILDHIASLQEFLSVYKPAFEIALDLQLPQHLPHIYQKVYTQFYDLLETNFEVGYNWSKCKILINQWLTTGRAEFVSLFHKIISHLYDKILEFKNVCAEQERYLEMFFELMSGAFDDELFIKDYNRVYPINLQFQLFIDNVNDFDKTQSDYLLEILQNIVEEPVDHDNQQENKPKLEAQSSDYAMYQNGESSKAGPSAIVDEELYDSIYDTLSEYLHIQQSSLLSNETKVLPELVQTALHQYVQLMNKWENNMNLSDFDATSSLANFESVNINKPSKEEIDNRVQAVLEMLPDLEVDYIKRCLERMNYRPEQVIARILDNELPLDLQMSHLTTSDTSKPGPSKANQPKLIPIISKKSNNKDALHLLDDKREKQDIKNLVLKASYVYDLDDDYDDRNEIHNTYENKIYRHVIQSDSPECNAVSDPSSSSGDEEVEQTSIHNEKPRNAFCEDPAVVRARREAQRGRTFKNSRNATNKSNTPKDQETAVKRDRDKKNTHKSSRANHNRKGAAQWKRNKGMIPS